MAGYRTPLKEENMDARFKAKLASGEKLLGTILSLPSPELAEIAAGAGFDWLFLDMEHGLLDFAAVQRMVQAATGRCPCLIRVPVNEPVWIKKALDIGAAGLIFPNVKNAREASDAVRESRFPPGGVRSVGIARAHGYGAGFNAYLERANKDTTLIAQVEHIDGVGEIDAILGIQGIDAIFVGPYDLSASMGRPGRTGDPEVRAAIARVRSACAARKTPAGIFVPDEKAAVAAFEEGFLFVCVGMDISLYAGVAARLVGAIKG
jgi:2-keto-3-deoxy-L-rhamnonate aldolase RhmA